ncbi:MAG: heavy metal-associated domain-containing protein [Ethanoligenens sp.]|uniref:heavy-metal-associated domain-containing protein n=1 Tax=Ethanoligenens sp. TaxID=2099655 RepID=UPI0039ED7E2A
MSKQSAYFKIPGLSGKHEVKDIKNSLAKIRGVTSVSVNTETDRVAVDYDSTGTNSEDICRHIKKLGMEPQLVDNQNHVM